MITLKRIYAAPDPGDGLRVLVDRLWPRGLKQDEARLDRWEKDIAPSDELRRWFGHDPVRWAEFRHRFREELAGKEGLLRDIVMQARKGRVTLLYAAKDEEHNNAVVLKELLEEKGGGG